MYHMYIILNGSQLEIPVLPAELTVKSAGTNEKATVLKLGEINILRGLALRTISWEGLLPKHSAPFVTGKMKEPISFVEAIQAARRSKKHGRFLITGTDLDVNMPIAVEDFSYKEKAGEPGDIYYSITLKEWKSYSASHVSVSPSGNITKSPPKRSGEPEPEKTYTVKAGDSLWAIAQKVYGDGSRWTELRDKNQSLIDSGNRGTGNHKNTIYPGQKFKL